ncbi:hypothetical protein Efla_003404 [Eimeria flavescens]
MAAAATASVTAAAAAAAAPAAPTAAAARAAAAAATAGAAGLPGYSLRSLRVEYTSPSATQLTNTILNLKRSLQWYPTKPLRSQQSAAAAAGPTAAAAGSAAAAAAATGAGGKAGKAAAAAVPWPVPERLGRREWRVTYLKSPFKFKYAVRHYVFVKHKYAFTFVEPQHPQAVISAVLGAMQQDVSCACSFEWHYGQTGDLGEDRIPVEGACPASAEKVEEILNENKEVLRIAERLEKKKLHWFHKADPTA